MKRKIIRLFVIALILSCFSVQSTLVAQVGVNYKKVQLSYVDLSDNAKISANPVITENIKLKKTESADNSIVVNYNSIINSNLSGIGGAFNEQGGEAFMSLTKKERKVLLEALFSSTKGSGFSLCRTAVGASDFGLGAYSYSEVADDYEMKYFSIDRDKKTVIPFILAAKKENPDLQMFASPWSPPAWMKISGKMDGGKLGDTTNVLKSDPSIYKAYALYFSKYIQEYYRNGVVINRLVIQNETDMNPSYPGCDMLPEQMSELVSGYIRPQFTKDGIKTEIWAGTFRDVNQPEARDDAQNFMKLNGSKDVTGVGLQYCPPTTMAELRKDYPNIKMMHTEGNCYNGKNSMAQARNRFSEIANWLNSGVDNYCYWNMVLNEEGKSGWGWKQNSLVNIDRQTGVISYNPDFAPVSLLSRYIRPGDQCLKVDIPKGEVAIAVRNNNRLVVFVENNTRQVKIKNFDLGGTVYAIEIPAQSLCALSFN